MPDFLKNFDGSGRKPRQVQIDALEWLANDWHKHKISVLSAPVGSGKSAIARAIQLGTDAAIIVPANILMRQYIDTYHNTNYLMGKSHYKCTYSGLSCKDWQELAGNSACSNCPYTQCKTNAQQGEPTFYNPMSYYYLARQSRDAIPDVMVVDEAHQLAPMILMLCGTRLSKSRFGFSDKCLNEIYLVQWLKAVETKLKRMIDQYTKTGDFKKLIQLVSDTEAIQLTREGMEENAQNYAIWISEGKLYGRKESFLNIKPIRPPRFITKRILSANRIVLMSGTVTATDVADLFPDSAVRFMDLPSPIPMAQRPVYYRPTPFAMNWQTNPAHIVREIEAVIKLNPGVNTIIHVTYSLARTLAPYFTVPILTNTAEDKDAVLEQFKKEGGILLAAGMAEGIDLPGDLCRLNIIPKLAYPDLKDPVVQKRKALEDGDEWYNLQTLTKLVQQTGRSTRTIDDFSKTYILDPGFVWRFKKCKDKLPKSFVESIIWSKE